MHFNQGFCQRQSDTESPVTLSAGLVQLSERLENLLQHFGRDTSPVILNREVDLAK